MIAKSASKDCIFDFVPKRPWDLIQLTLLNSRLIPSSPSNLRAKVCFILTVNRPFFIQRDFSFSNYCETLFSCFNSVSLKPFLDGQIYNRQVDELRLGRCYIRKVINCFVTN